MIEFLENKICRKILAVFSFACSVASVIVHCFSIFEINLIRNSFLFLIMFGLIGICHGAMVVNAQPEFKLYKLTVENNYQKWFFSLIPKWIKYAVYAFSFYLLLNMFICFPMISTVKADIFCGKYVLFPVKAQALSKNIIREISVEEYERQTSYETKFFSGISLAFFIMPALFFWFERPKPNWSSFNNHLNA